MGPRDSLGGQTASPRPREVFPQQGGDPPHERGSQAVPDRRGLDDRFDSTRGFPGEGPEGVGSRPWFLASIDTRALAKAKRQRLDGGNTKAELASPPTPLIPSTERRLVFSDRVRRQAKGDGQHTHTRVDTALGRFLRAQRTRAERTLGKTPVPRAPSPRPPAFACLRELQDFTHPLPPVPAGESLRRTFIRHFGGLHGMDAASFEEVWKVSKNGYNTAQDAHFVRFQTDFLSRNPRNKFHPLGIQPGDLVGFLRWERERGASHPSLKDASASVSTACAQASDGQVQLGAQDSVIKYLKYVKQSEVPDRGERMVVYPDVAKLIQIAWELGPNGNLGLEALKHKLVILLMVDTAARPSDIWRLYRTAVGKYRQIEFLGDTDVQIRYYWPKEVDPFSSRTNATNTWFSQWVVIRGTTPPSTDTVACLHEFLARSTDPELFASDYIAQLGSSAQPLIFARTKDGRRQKCSVDHISVILKRALASAKISTMKPRHLRGASTSKIVQLSPAAMSIAMGLGRWTTAKTFQQHYNAPVTLLTAAVPPEAITMHGQQLLRWGWTPTPPSGVTAIEYDEPHGFWVGRSIPRLGRIAKFDDGKYFIPRRQVTHMELMGLISAARQGR